MHSKYQKNSIFYKVNLSKFYVKVPIVVYEDVTGLKKVSFKPSSTVVSLEFVDTRSKTAFKIWKFIYFFISSFIKCLRNFYKKKRAPSLFIEQEISDKKEIFLKEAFSEFDVLTVNWAITVTNNKFVRFCF